MPATAATDDCTAQVRRQALLIFALSLAVRLGYFITMRLDPTKGNDGTFLVQGYPYGDALCWHDIAQSITQGSELWFWQGRRLAYSLLLATIYLWTGVSSNVAVALNIVFNAATAPLLWVICRRLFPPAVGLTVVLWFLCDPATAAMACTTMTETPGLFFLAWHVWLLFRALDSAAPQLLLFGSGLTLGLSNVIRTLTLPALPLEMLVVAVASRRKASWPATMRHAGWLLAGALACVAPAMLSNYHRNGILTISDNVSADLFAGTSRSYGSWNPQVDDLASQEGLWQIGPRYKFFMDKAKQNLAENYVWILQQLPLRSWRIARNAALMPNWCLFAWLGFHLVWSKTTTSEWLRPSDAVAVALVVLSMVLGPEYLGGVLLVAMAWALRWRHEGAVVLAMLAATTIVPLALFNQGVIPWDRLFVVWRWLCIGLCLGTMSSVCMWVDRREGEVAAPFYDALVRLTPRMRRSAIALTCGYFSLSLVILAYRNYVHPRTYRFETPPDHVIRALLAEIDRRDPEILARREKSLLQPGNLLTIPASHWDYQSPNGRLVLWPGELLPEMYFVAADDKKCLIRSACYNRNYDRTLVNLRSMPAFGWNVPFLHYNVVVAGDARPWRGRQVLMLARTNAAPNQPIQSPYLEVIALAEYDRATKTVDLERMFDATKNAECREILLTLRGSAASAKDLTPEP